MKTLSLTKRLSLKEYGGKYHDLNEMLLAQVNKEEKAWFPPEVRELPQYNHAKVKKDMTFWLVFFKTQLYQLAP